MPVTSQGYSQVDMTTVPPTSTEDVKPDPNLLMNNGAIPPDQVYTSMTCSNCGIILDLTEETFDDFVRMRSNKFDTMLVNRVAKHLADTKRSKPTEKG